MPAILPGPPREDIHTIFPQAPAVTSSAAPGRHSVTTATLPASLLGRLLLGRLLLGRLLLGRLLLVLRLVRRRVGGQRGHGRLLWDVDPADGLHPLLAFLLLLEQLA